MLCDQLEGWDREDGREGDARGKRYGDTCICITDSLCYKAETNNNKKRNTCGMWLRRIFTGLSAYTREGRGERKAENNDLSTHFKTLKI